MCVSFKIIMMMSVTRQHNTRRARPRPQCARPRPRPQCARPRSIVWSQTGLVLRWQDNVTRQHITAQSTKFYHSPFTASPPYCNFRLLQRYCTSGNCWCTHNLFVTSLTQLVGWHEGHLACNRSGTSNHKVFLFGRAVETDPNLEGLLSASVNCCSAS